MRVLGKIGLFFGAIVTTSRPARTAARMPRAQRSIALAALAVSGCMVDAATAAPPLARNQFTKSLFKAPLADHHIHLLSPAAAEWRTPFPLPEITLPEDLARVVRARNQLRTDQKALEELYTPDALYYRGGAVGWARGHKAAAGHVVWTISDYPYRIVPVAFNRNAASAHIAGYFLEGTD